LLGAFLRTTWVGFAKDWVAHSLLRSRTNAFASFLEKKEPLNVEFYWRLAPRSIKNNVVYLLKRVLIEEKQRDGGKVDRFSSLASGFGFVFEEIGGG
jgi:hypothetical protein